MWRGMSKWHVTSRHLETTNLISNPNCLYRRRTDSYGQMRSSVEGRMLYWRRFSTHLSVSAVSKQSDDKTTCCRCTGKIKIFLGIVDECSSVVTDLCLGGWHLNINSNWCWYSWATPEFPIIPCRIQTVIWDTDTLGRCRTCAYFRQFYGAFDPRLRR